MRRNGQWIFALAVLLAWSGTPLFSQSQEPDKKQEKKTDKKAKKSDAAPPVGDTADVAKEKKNLSKVLRAFSDTMEGNSPSRLRELMDERFYDLPRFEDQVTEFLRNNAELRMNFRESTSELKGDKATLIVDADMTYALKSSTTQEKKRHERIQFDFVRTATGWKIFEITPRSFFTP